MLARLAAVAILLFVVSPPLRAERREGRAMEAFFTTGASSGDGGTALALSTGLRAMFSSRAGVEVEIAHARRLDFTLEVCPAPLVCVAGGQIPVTGRTLSLVPHLVIQLLPASQRLQAYVQAGVGAGHVRQRYFFGPPLSDTLAERTRSNLTPALSFGGGATIQISPRIAVGADVRSLHLRDDRPTPERYITPSGTLSAVRVGSRVSWRF